MLTDEHVMKLNELVFRKLEEVYKKNACKDLFGSNKIVAFNAWQTFLRSSLSLEVVDIEEGEQPGFMRIGGQSAAMRIPNPSNKTGLGREFIIVPLEFAEHALMLIWIPNEWSPPKR